MRRVMLQSLSDGTLVTDLVSGFTHGYSHRKLKDSYLGSSLLIRRSSDNATSDIGFDGQDLDEATLSSFIGANSGFESILYDQVGSRNLTTSLTPQQPTLVLAGVIEKSGTKPFAQFNASANYMITSSTDAPITDEDCTIFAVFESQSAVSIQDVFNEHTGTVSESNRLVSDTRASNFRGFDYRPDVGTLLSLVFASQQPTSTRRVYIFRRSGTTIELYDDTGSLIDSDTSSQVFGSDTNLVIGRLNNPSPVNYFGGKFAELLINNTALSSGDQTLVLNNIKAYYGI